MAINCPPILSALCRALHFNGRDQCVVLLPPRFYSNCHYLKKNIKCLLGMQTRFSWKFFLAEIPKNIIISKATLLSLPRFPYIVLELSVSDTRNFTLSYKLSQMIFISPTSFGRWNQFSPTKFKFSPTKFSVALEQEFLCFLLAFLIFSKQAP